MEKIIKNKKIILAIAVIFGCLTFVSLKLMAKKDSEYEEYKLALGPMKIIVEATGTVKSENEVEVKVPISGRIEKILVVEGDRVKKDQVLFYVSSSERAALLDAAKARGPEEYKEWEQNFKMTPVYSPIDGTIIQRRYEPGQTFSAEATVLVMSDRLTVKAKVDETDIGKVVVNQNAEIILDAYQDKIIKAKIDQIAFDAVVENSVTTYVVDVLPDQAPKFMRSGMTANVNIEVANRQNVLTIPIIGAIYHNDKSYVLVKDSNSENFIEKEVKLGATEGNKIEVVDGLKAGDTIYIKKFPFEKNK